ALRRHHAVRGEAGLGRRGHERKGAVGAQGLVADREPAAAPLDHRRRRRRRVDPDGLRARLDAGAPAGSEEQYPPAAWLAARVGLARDVLRRPSVLTHDGVALVALDDRLELGGLVTGLDREQRRIGPQLLVCRRLDVELLDATLLAALADDPQRVP